MISSVKVNPKKTMNNFLVIKEGRQTHPLQGGREARNDEIGKEALK